LSNTPNKLSHIGKVRKFEEETQLKRKGVLVKGFGYLLEDYLGLVVVRYPILVRVFGLSFVWRDLSRERHCTC
jgi:hypothetical protein